MEQVYRLLRLVSSPDTAETPKGLEAADTLFQSDQLNIERSSGRVFREFSEGRTAFLPTYKYIPGLVPKTAEGEWYDQRPDKKKRCPAWCDRVLYRVNPRALHEEIKLLQYRRIDELYISDHKPVSALFEISVKEINREEKDSVLQEIVRSAVEITSNTHAKLRVVGGYTFNCTYKYQQPNISKKRGVRSLSTIGPSQNRGTATSRGYSVIQVDCNKVTLENLNKFRPCTYSLLNLPSWLVVQEDDIKGVIPPGSFKIVPGRVIDEEFEGDTSSPMSVIKVSVEGGLDKMIAAVDYKRDAKQRQQIEKEEDKKKGGKLHKVLGRFGDGNIKI